VGGRPLEIEQLGQFAQKIGASSHLQLLPFRPQEEMPIFTAAADVLVSPRVKGINPPGKLFSYLSSGRPVVATDRPIHNQILDERCAILTEPDPGSLAEGIISALRDRPRVERITQGASELLKSDYSPARRAQAYEELFRAVTVSN
jgi:glycosyltransferase involved in cell wall biosynthesis